jgi:hypothetical protein
MPFGAYCYTTMSFGLKNAGATYQRAIQMCLKDQIRDQLVEAYVDDVVVKTKVASSLVGDLDQTFKALNAFQWKLNPKKCIFGVPSGTLLRNIVSRDGIRPNPEKVKVILRMKPPKSVKDIQKLTGCMATLSRFISRLGDKGLPFFKLLKVSEKFVWSEEADIAFAELKRFLTTPPVLTAPKEGETLLLYIAATNRVVSMAIIVERPEVGRAYVVQRPVYFISEVLNDSKARYPHLQKLLYAILITSRSCVIISKPTPLRWLPSILQGTSSTTKMLTGVSSNGQWSFALTLWGFEVAQQSSPKHWLISLLNGQI